MTILSIGKCSYDITCSFDGYPLEGKKYLLNEKIESGGGSAANVSYLLGIWGETSYFSGVIGSDDYGTKLKKELEQATVKTELMEISYEVGTSLSLTLVNKKTSSRTKLDIVDNMLPVLKKYEYSLNPDVVFVDGREYAASINAFNKFPNAKSIVDADRTDRDLLELCKFVKYIICSQSFAERVSGTKVDFNNSVSLVEVYKRLKERYPNAEVVVTLKNMGALYCLNGEIKIMPGIKTNMIDPSGAGDIFNGAFSYGIANNFDLEKAVTYANIAAGLSVSRLGGRTSIPTLKEVVSYYNQKFNIEEAVEETNQKEVKPEDDLPDIPDAATFKIPDITTMNEGLEAMFSIGGASISVPSGTSNV